MFQWVLVVLLLLRICFCFVVGGGLCVVSVSGLTDIIEAFNSTSRYLDD